MDPQFRFFTTIRISPDSYQVDVFDADQRRWFSVTKELDALERKSFWDVDPLEENEDYDKAANDAEEKAKNLFAEHADRLAPEITGLKVDSSGKVVTPVVDPSQFPDFGIHYPSLQEYELPAGIPTVLRSELTELSRISGNVDRVSFGDSSKVFKYDSSPNRFVLWDEIQCHARLPRHRNIIPVERLVVDEISGTRVVGFLTPFISGVGLNTEWKNRPFKLKYFQQLMKAAAGDWRLNLKYGIVHQDVALRNLIIDTATDDLVLIDFGEAARIGAKKERETRNDVKGVILALHEAITRDPCYNPSYLHLLDETPLVAEPKKWIKHRDVELDPGLTPQDYYDELMRWVAARRGRDTAKAPALPIIWPSTPLPPPGGRYSFNQQKQTGTGDVKKSSGSAADEAPVGGSSGKHKKRGGGEAKGSGMAMKKPSRAPVPDDNGSGAAGEAPISGASGKAPKRKKHGGDDAKGSGRVAKKRSRVPVPNENARSEYLRKLRPRKPGVSMK
ncbi:hypothetical protein MFIFM68171_10004 [Madurella fahalii]|uniref:non-specific serine/threonine protein kinase n=1 Tax=Madurella fahalii TaxID=1157608 RepID=A0ABQ0GQ12_9PEZI